MLLNRGLCSRFTIVSGKDSEYMNLKHMSLAMGVWRLTLNGDFWRIIADWTFYRKPFTITG